MSWIILVAAGLFEVVWATALKMSNGFTNIKADILFVVGMALSVGLLSLAMKAIPMGTAYAVWTGIGAVGLTEKECAIVNIGAAVARGEQEKLAEVPYSGSRKIKGGIPASVCMEGGWLHSSYVKPEGGGKLFVAGETMVALLMGYPDGERNVHKMMQTRWWGKDSRLYMKELIAWSIKE